MTQEQKALEVLRVLAQIAAEGNSMTIANDWGFGTATVIDQDGAHTHVGFDGNEDEQRNFEVFVDQLHGLLVEKRGLSWSTLSTKKIDVLVQATNQAGETE